MAGLLQQGDHLDQPIAPSFGDVGEPNPHACFDPMTDPLGTDPCNLSFRLNRLGATIGEEQVDCEIGPT